MRARFVSLAFTRHYSKRICSSNEEHQSVTLSHLYDCVAVIEFFVHQIKNPAADKKLNELNWQ